MASTTKNKVDIVGLANKIKSGEYPTQPVDLDQFFKTNINGKWIVDENTRIQVRERYISEEFVERIVQKIKNTGDESQLDNLTLVEMPDGSFKIVDASHTASIRMRLGHTCCDAHIVSYEKDLGGSLANAHLLGNVLNVPNKEKQIATDKDIRNAVYQFVAEKYEKGLDTRLTDEDYNLLTTLFPGYSRKTLAQWASYSPHGSRQNPPRLWDPDDRKNIKLGYESDSEYDGFVIMNPMEVGHATTSILGSAIVRMARENKDKCLIILYCMSKAQVSQWVDKDGNPTENQKKILETYRKVSQNFNCTIKLKMLKWYYD